MTLLKHVLSPIVVRWLTVVTVVVFSCGSVAEIRRPKENYGRLRAADQQSAHSYVQKVRSWKGWVDPTGAVNSSSSAYHARLSPFKKSRAKYDSIVKAAASRYNLPKPLLHAIITAESAYNPRALSSAGAKGLMQLMPATAKRYGVNNVYNPAQNVQGGSRFLRDLMIKFNKDINLVLAAYNAGEGAVVRYGYKVPPYEETQKYVVKVKAYLALYSESS